LRHLTPEEIALNQEELTCLGVIEQLEMQETSLEYELKQDIDETRRMIATQTLRVLYKALLIKHRERASKMPRSHLYRDLLERGARSNANPRSKADQPRSKGPTSQLPRSAALPVSKPDEGQNEKAKTAPFPLKGACASHRIKIHGPERAYDGADISG
jgi:hypothetical protein